MTPRRHGRGGRESGLAGCPSSPTPLVGFDSFPPNLGEATRMFWKDRLPPCQSVPYLLLKMAAFASRGADAPLPIECLTSLGVATGPRRRSLAQVGSGGSSSPDKVRSLSTSPPPSRRAGSSQVEMRLPSSCLHWMTCMPTRHLSCHVLLSLTSLWDLVLA